MEKKWVVVVIFSIIGLIFGVTGAAGMMSEVEAWPALLLVIWIFLGIGGNFGVTILEDVPIFIGMYRGSREKGESIASALSGPILIGIFLMLIKSLAGPIIPIIKIAEYKKSEV
jgi:hypothetical protein